MYLKLNIHYYTHDGYCSDPYNQHEYTKLTKYLLFKIPSFLKDDNGVNFNMFNEPNMYKLYDKYKTCKLKNNKDTELLFNEWNLYSSRIEDESHDWCSQMEEYEPKNYYLIKL